MPPALAHLRIMILCLAASACAGMASDTLGKETMEAMLNAELMTGDSAATIEAFFQRHAIPYTYDASIRRYFGTVERGAPLWVFIYTDTDQKMTVTLVQAPKSMPMMQRPRRGTQDYLLDDPGISAPRAPH